MELFGPFEVIREIESGGGATVYKARKEGDAKGEYAVKVFSLQRLVSEEADEVRSELDPLFKDIGSSFTSRINLQKKAAETSPYFAPILAGGHDNRGAWYATHFYTRSVKGMLDRFVALEPRDLLHLVQSVVKAALHLKKTSGRSHGNLKPSNVFIEGTGRPRNSQVVVCDPLAGGANEAVTYELADLRSIGEMIYQLVLRRKVDFSSGWVILPVETSKEWTALFGKKAAEWLKLCNRLLDPHLSLDQYTLEQLDADLPGLKPRLPATATLVPAAVAVVLAGGIAAYFLLHKSTQGTLEVFTDPPGVAVVVTPVGNVFLAQTNKTSLDGKPLKLQLEQGEYMLRAEYGDLEPRRTRVSIAVGKTATEHLNLLYGRLVVVSSPAGAQFRIGGNLEKTPYTNAIFKPGAINLQLDLTDYVSAYVSGTVPTNGLLVLATNLVPPKPGEEVVDFSSDPPGVSVYIDGTRALVTSPDSPVRTKLTEGTHTIRAELSGWPTQQKLLVVNLKQGRTPPQSFYFQHGVLAVTNTQPENLDVYVNGRLAATSPTNLYLPVGPVQVAFRSEGYETNTQSLTIADKGRYPFSPILKALAGFVEVTSDPPGAEIVDQAGKSVGETGADGSGRFPLPPGAYTLRALFSGLKPVGPKPVTIEPGKPKQMDFAFDYGTLTLNVQPPAARTNLTVRRSDGISVSLSRPVYQVPGSNYTYVIDALPRYVPVTNAFVVARNEKKTLPITLARVQVPVTLTSQPPGAKFFAGDGLELKPAGGSFMLPWGPVELVARLGRLVALTNSTDIRLDGPNTIPQFKFDYGTLVLTNLPNDVVVKSDNVTLEPQPGPMRIAYDRPGRNTYDLYEGGQKVDTVITNLVSGARILLDSEIAKREFRNSIGLVLVKVPNLLGPGKEGWVGKSEVTQAEYERVMGPNANPSKFKGADLPVQNVSWVQATEFCRKLTQTDTRHPPGPPGRYVLPTHQQWQIFEAGSALSNAVYGVAQPARVDSKGPSNPLGIYDVLGNVREWLEGGDPTNKPFVGGGFSSTPGFRGMGSFTNIGELQKDLGSDDLGLRVIWIPNRP